MEVITSSASELLPSSSDSAKHLECFYIKIQILSKESF